MSAPEPLGGRTTARGMVFVVAAFRISRTLWSLHPLLACEPGAALTLDQLATFGPAAAALLAVITDRVYARNPAISCAPTTVVTES